MFKNLRPLFPYLRRYKWGLFLGALTSVLTNGIAALFPKVIQAAIDSLDSGVTTQKLLRYPLLIIAVAIGKGIFQFLTRWVVIGISRDIEFDMRNDLFRKLESLEYGFYQRTRTGDIMAKATNDLNAVRMMMGPAIMYSANTIAFTIFSLAFMLHISVKLTLWTFIPLPIASVIIQYFGRQIHDRFESIQAQFSDISSRAQENFSGARLVRAYAQEQGAIRAWEKDNDEYIRRNLPLVRLTGMLWPSLEFVLGIGIALTLWLGGREVILGHIKPGGFVAYMTYMMMLVWPIIAFGWVINVFSRGTASAGRIHDILTAVPEIKDEPAEIKVPLATDIRGDIEFRHLTFAFPRDSKVLNADGTPGINPSREPGTPVLKDVNLHIPAGTSLAIVGPTGSGKSTLVSLIPRIYDAEPGMVLIDGRPVREYPIETLRRNIGFVPQETFLFSDTIRENIAFGAEDATDEEVRQAAEIARIAQDVESFPEGYHTTVGERGLTLSGGQKQRTAIARAVIRNPRILVLDDALASVDTQTEEHILNHLREVMKGRTTVFISHRVSTVRNADRIAVLHDGHIVEYGTHDELVALNGYYTELYNKQLLEEELETV